MKLELAHRQEVIVVSKLAIQQYLPQRQTSQPHGYAFLLVTTSSPAIAKLC
jgi:hypothetical protein